MTTLYCALAFESIQHPASASLPAVCLAAGVYITDADWHDIYDRSKPIGNTQAVVLEENCWIGDGSIICKGVTIGRNSVIGAGSVVSRSIPANVIAAGNPATVIKPLDADKNLVTREKFAQRPPKTSHGDRSTRPGIAQRKHLA